MRQVAKLQEVRLMRLEEIMMLFQVDTLSCDDAAKLLGASVKTFYRMRQRYEEEGLQGLMDKRLNKISTRKQNKVVNNYSILARSHVSSIRVSPRSWRLV